MASVTETVFISAQVPKELDEQIIELAKKHDRSRSAEVRIALKAHVEACDAGEDDEAA